MKRETLIPRIDWPRKVEELGFQCRIIVSLQHIKEILRRRHALVRIPYAECLVIYQVHHRLVRINRNGRDFGNEADRLPQDVLNRSVIRILIQSIQTQNRPGKHVHDVVPLHREDHVTVEIFRQCPQIGHP